MSDINLKFDKLKNILRECGSVTVAFSSGVDSTFLVKTAREVLGKEKVLAITVASAFIPANELMEAEEFCIKNDINHKILKFDVLSDDEITANPYNRCYICKKAIFSMIKETVEELGFSETVICEGSNIDDTGDYRPGMQAIKELGIKSPLMEAGLSKSDIRMLSKEMNLNTWNKPSAACLASRCAYDERITEEKLKMVEKAEDYLKSKGFSQLRVRIHGNDSYIARIELSNEELIKFVSELNDSGVKSEVYDYIKELGFSYITLDLKGYRVGSMNEILGNKAKS